MLSFQTGRRNTYEAHDSMAKLSTAAAGEVQVSTDAWTRPDPSQEDDPLEQRLQPQAGQPPGESGALPRLQQLREDLSEHPDDPSDGGWNRSPALDHGGPSPGSNCLRHHYPMREGFLQEGHGYDAAVVSMDLALLHLRQGRTAELKTLARRCSPSSARRMSTVRPSPPWSSSRRRSGRSRSRLLSCGKSRPIWMRRALIPRSASASLPVRQFRRERGATPGSDNRFL